jgi:hypothetical protein
MKFKIKPFRLAKNNIIRFLIREGASEAKMGEASAMLGIPVAATYQFAFEEDLISEEIRNQKFDKLKEFYDYDEIVEE